VTVAELIDRLRAFDPDARVVVPPHLDGPEWEDVHDLRAVRLCRHVWGGYCDAVLGVGDEPTQPGVAIN
jgi:hypothetical protein